MAIIRSFQSDYYRIPLEETLTDSMHGDMPEFDLNTVRIEDNDGFEGVGNAFTACPNRSYLEVQGFGLEHNVTEPFIIKDGFAIAIESSGHDIDFNRNKLKKLKVKL